MRAKVQRLATAQQRLRGLLTGRPEAV
jgi:hypothetical protein